MNRRLLPPLLVLSLFLLSSTALAKKKPKEEAPPPPPQVGWVDMGKGLVCYNPPAFTGISEVQRRQSRQTAWNELTRLLQGEKISEISFRTEEFEAFEVAFLGRPEKIEGFARRNWESCQQVANGSMSMSDYRYFLAQAPKEAQKGECQNPLMYELHDYLDIQKDWQVRRHMCAGDKVLLETTETSKYAVSEAPNPKQQKWITSMGDPTVPRAGEGYPCPECPLGALVVRFENEDSGEVSTQTMGASLEFTAPGNGYISFGVNDTTYFDNRFFEINGMKDYLAIDIFPPVREGAGAGN